MASWPAQRKVIGTDVPRIEAFDKVAGRAKFTFDIHRPGLLYGRIYGSPHPAAVLTKLDLAAAKAMPGVKAVIAIKHEGQKIRFEGEEIAAVAAESKQIAEDAVRAIRAEFTIEKPITNIEQAKDPAWPRVYNNKTNFGSPKTNERGDVERAFPQAAVVADEWFSTQTEVHAPLETHGAVAAWDGDELTVWCSTQGIFSVRDGLAGNLHLSHAKVRVICDHMGGGFGSKFGPGVEGVTAARLAREAGAPVKLMHTRRMEFLVAGNRPSSIQHVRAAAGRDGALLAYDLESWGSAGVGAGAGTAGGSGASAFPAPYIYHVPNVRTRHYDYFTNAQPSRAMRAPGHPPASVGMEQMMDALALQLGMDPVEFRIRNDPSEVRRRQYRIGAEKIGWAQQWNKKPGSGAGVRKRGLGCGGASWGGGGRGTKARITIHPDASVVLECGTQDLGTGTRTIPAIVIAETFGLRPEDITVRIGDTNFPPSGGSGGSTTAASVAPAIRVTAERALAELNQRAEGKTGLSFQQKCALLGTGPLQVDGEWEAGLSSSGAGGVQFAEVEVDTETGQVRVIKIVCVQDCGLVLNKLTAESQINGGIIMGIGYALFEDRILDRQTGHMLNPNFESYKLPGGADMPVIEAVLMDMPERGVIGIGEPVTIPTAGAIACAIHNAIGVRVRDLPMTPDRVLNALAGREQRPHSVTYLQRHREETLA